MNARLNTLEEAILVAQEVKINSIKNSIDAAKYTLNNSTDRDELYKVHRKMWHLYLDSRTGYKFTELLNLGNEMLYNYDKVMRKLRLELLELSNDLLEKHIS